jgi:hypothetical protein
MKYTVDYFIKKFEAIPEGLWNIGAYHSLDGKSCALGHCGGNAKNHLVGCEEGLALWELFWNVLQKFVHDINDCEDYYPQPTPKQRILAALYDIKAQQNNVDAAKKIIQSKLQPA